MMRIRLLGEMTLEVDGRQVELPASRRARSLLGVLALERRTHPRAQLAARFWPDVLDESARTSLRSALSALRRAVGADADRYLLASRDTVALAGPDEVWTDVGEFDRLLAEGRLRTRSSSHAANCSKTSTTTGSMHDATSIAPAWCRCWS